MMENEQKEVKVVGYTWWIGAIIGVIIGLANSDSRYVDSQPVIEAFKWGLMWTIFGAIIGYIIDQTRTSTVVKNISENIELGMHEENTPSAIIASWSKEYKNKFY